MQRVLLLVPLVVHLVALESDVLVEAWSEGRYAEIILLTDSAADLTEGRIWLARGLQFEDPNRALRLLGAAPVVDWPRSLCGFRAQVLAEVLSAGPGEPSAVRTALMDALDYGGERVEVDRCLAMLVQVYAQEGNVDAAKRCAQVLWSSWPASRWRPAAGLYLAQELREGDPSGAEAVLRALLAFPHLTVAQREDAADQLCRILIVDRPESVLRLVRTFKDEDDRRQFWHARARVSLGEEGALDDLRACSTVMLRRYAVDDALLATSVEPKQLLRQALEAADRGESKAAAALLLPLVVSDKDCLLAWLDLPVTTVSQLDLRAFGERSDLLLCLIAVVARDDRASACSLLAKVCDGLAIDDASLPVLLDAWERLLRKDVETEAYAVVHRRLLACGQVHRAVGEAWCREAVVRRGADVQAAWDRAAELLPVGHPWLPEVAARVAVMHWRRWQGTANVGDLAIVEEVAERIAWRGDSAEHMRCRFLLAQVAAARGDGGRATMLIAALRPHADARQASLLDELQRKLSGR